MLLLNRTVVFGGKVGRDIDSLGILAPTEADRTKVGAWNTDGASFYSGPFYHV